MKILSKIFGTITTLRSTAIQNGLFHVPRAHLSSEITPIRMSVNVFLSDRTNHNAPPLVIMHGLLGSKHNWRGVSKALEKKTRRKIYNVDARNHGESPHVPEHTSAHMAADVLDLMKRENLKKICVLGHSMGGRSMMYFALKYPKLVEKAIIVDISPISIPDNLEQMEDIFHGMKDINVSPNLTLADARPIISEQLKEWVNDKATVDFVMMNLKKLESGEFVWRANVDALMENFKQYRIPQYLKGMEPFTGPVLFVAGKFSDFFNLADWPKIKEIFPNAELKWLEATHLVHFDQPEEFMKLVTEFLKNKDECR